MINKPTMKRKEREKEARKQAILYAAGRVFSRKSYHEATLEEIAEEAELAKGTLYNYYRDKQDIFASLLQCGHDRFHQCIAEVSEQNTTLPEFVSALFVKMLDMLIAHGYFVRLLVTASASLDEAEHSRMWQDLRWHMTKGERRIAEALGNLDETKRVSEADRLTAARMIIASARYLFIVHGVNQWEDNLRELIRQHTGLVCRALKAGIQV